MDLPSKELIGAVWVPLSILAFSVLLRAASMAYVAFKTHRTKMLELAVTTANSEFQVNKEYLERLGRKPRPMSSYVIFHVLLFKRLERADRQSVIEKIAGLWRRPRVDVALQETLDEIERIFPVYAGSGLSDYGELWDIDPPRRRRTRRGKTRATGQAKTPAPT